MKKIIFAFGILIITIGVFFTYRHLFRGNGLVAYQIEQVWRGDVWQEIVETGVVRPTKELFLSSKQSGEIKAIYVELGDNVKAGQELIRLDSTTLLLELRAVEAGLKAQQAQLNNLLAGPGFEQIQVTQAAVDSQERVLKNAQQNLRDIEILAEKTLIESHQGALTSLRSAYLTFFNTIHSSIKLIQEIYFTQADQEGIMVRTHQDLMLKNLGEIRNQLDLALNHLTQSNLDLALLITRRALTTAVESIGIIREQTESSIYKHRVISSHRALLDAERININNALTLIINSQEAIALTKINNQRNINTAQAQLSLSEKELKRVQGQLALLMADPRHQELEFHRAQIEQTRARMSLLENQIQETIIRSPINGRVVKIEREVGEMVLAGTALASLISDMPLQIEVDIYEEDVVKIQIGNPVEINLIAFPNKIFRGKVIAVDPTETLIGGVIHYQTTIVFIDELPEGVRLGMTTDVVIQTTLKKDVLIIPEDAIQEIDNKFIVEIFQEGMIESEKREVKTGLWGEYNRVEIISGLNEGEQVIIR